MNGIGEKYHIDHELKRVISKAKIMLSEPNLPAAKRELFMQLVKTYLNKDSVSEDELRELASREYKTLNENHQTHEQLIVDKLKTEDDIAKFVKRWREHFVKTMKPAHLPKYWSVDHPVTIR